MKQKEDLLRESKAKLATMDSVKSQIDTLMKVRPRIHDSVGDLLTSFTSLHRPPRTYARKSATSSSLSRPPRLQSQSTPTWTLRVRRPIRLAMTKSASTHENEWTLLSAARVDREEHKDDSAVPLAWSTVSLCMQRTTSTHRSGHMTVEQENYRPTLIIHDVVATSMYTFDKLLTCNFCF